MPNYGHLSLSCAKIERPSLLEKPPCKVRFFTQNCSRKYRPKVAAASSISNHFSSRFSTSRTNGPRSLSRVKAGTHSAYGERLHTTAYTPKQGASLLCSPAGLRCSVCNLVMLLFSLCAQYFLYVRGEGVSLSSVHSAHSRNARCSPC